MMAVLSSASVIAGVTTSVIPTATAATYYTPYKTHIVMNGKDFSDPYHIVAKEYSTAEPTSWLPIWYLFNVLNQLGVQSTWDGQHWNLQLPDGLNADLTDPVTSHNSGDIAIQLNGTTVQYAPRIAYKDPGGTETTSYIPIWYVQQVARRLGVTYSWDGTTWGMTSSFTPPQLNKLALVKDFATVLNIPENSSGTNPYDDVSTADWPYVNAVAKYFQADSSTHFGAQDASTLDILDHAYQLYVGIPDSHMTWNAGGSLNAWGNAIHLNQGLNTGNLFPAQESTVKLNLTSLHNGYSKDADGTYHLWFKPYDGWWYSQIQGWNLSSSTVSSDISNAIQTVNGMSFTNRGSTATYRVKGLSINNPQGVILSSRYGQTKYSLNNGATWVTSTSIFGYDSRMADAGGVSSPPANVLVQIQGEAELSSGVYESGNGDVYADVTVTFATDGSPAIKYSSGTVGVDSHISSN